MKNKKCYWYLRLASWLSLVAVCKCIHYSFAEPVLAQQQVIGDPTLGTTVTGNGTTFEIAGGTTVGERNLFHSFSRFDVPVGGIADFLNNSAIVNIFSRVTGGTPSDIQGLVRDRGNANLFLMNPSGIVFGKDAQLDIGGSFVATTANAIGFPGGEFSLNSSVSPENTLLSVNPSAFLFNQIGAQSITNQSTTGLQVRDGKSLLLVGGDLKLDGGVLFAPSGRIELGGVAGLGIVGLNADENLRLSFPDGLARADIFLTKNAVVNTSGEGGGDLQVYGNNITLANRSFIFSDTLGSQNGTGVFVRASKLNMSGGSSISASTVNSGNAGNVQIQASDTVEITDLNSLIGSVVTESATGSGGNITIEARRLTTRNGGQVLTNTNSLGNRPGGNITVAALESIEVNGTTANGQLSSLFSQTNGAGNAGNLTISTERLSISGNGARVFSFTSSSGNTGTLTIKVGTLILQSGGQALTITAGKGNAGTVIVNASKSIEVGGQAPDSRFASILGAQVAQEGEGNAGDMTIKTPRLTIRDGAQVNNSTFGKGDAGNLIIRANDVEAIGESADGRFDSGIHAQVEIGAEGDAKDVLIEAKRLSLRDGGQVSAATFGKGNAGNLTVRASDVEIIGTAKVGRFPSKLRVLVEPGGVGNGGSLTVEAERLTVKDAADITAGTYGMGNAGDIRITAQQLDLLNDGLISGETFSEGTAGKISIQVGQLIARNGGQISASSGRQNQPGNFGKGGNLTVTASDLIEVDGIGRRNRSGIFTETSSPSRAGDLTVNAKQLIVRNGAGISSGASGSGSLGGDGGNLNINVSESVELIGRNRRFLSAVVTEANGRGNAGDLTIQTKQLIIRDGAIVSTQTFGIGNAGSIFVRDSDRIELNQGYIFSQIREGAVGNAGDINIQTRQISLTNGGQIAASVSRQQGNLPGGQGKGGNIEMAAFDSVNISGVDADGFSSGVFTNTQRGAVGQGGDIKINTSNFRIADGAVVTAQTLNSSDGGNITINTHTLEAVGGGQVLTGTFSSGKAGNITLHAADSIKISGTDSTYATRFARFGRDVVANSSAGSGLFADTDINSQGQGGTISLSATNLNLSNTGRISAQSLGIGKAGNINITLRNSMQADNGGILTNSTSAGGGNITVQARDMRLRNNSDIRTNSGGADGGNITLDANTIIALEDSDILAFAPEGQGGNITFNTRAFLSSPLYRPTPPTSDRATLETLAANNKVDVNASGRVSGTISGVPDITFLQNSLTDLQQNPIDTNALIANSCIARTDKLEGTFIITGSDGLPNRPGDISPSNYPTGTVRSVEKNVTNSTFSSLLHRPWKTGDPIVEPSGVYQLPSGQLVMSRECQ